METCKWCGEAISLNGFPDFQSYKEYQISGLCWDCQIAIFDNYSEYGTLQSMEHYNTKKEIEND